MNSPTNQSQPTNSPYGSLNLDVREARMYTLMKDEVINFICNIFITFSESELNNHDEIAKSMVSVYARYQAAHGQAVRTRLALHCRQGLRLCCYLRQQELSLPLSQQQSYHAFQALICPLLSYSPIFITDS